jgi:proteasome lid subunit RPN8/RPN11
MKHDRIRLPRRLWQQMLEQVRSAAPLEACGLLAGNGIQAEALYAIPNILQSPVQFRMDPYAQLQAFESIEEAGLELLAIYHSHPAGPEMPSETDIREARYEAVALICSPRDGNWQARAFWINKNRVAELPIEIIDL